MSRYVTPLPSMMAAAIEFVFARAAALDADAAGKLQPLSGRWLKFVLQGLEIDLWLTADGERLRVMAEPETSELEPDAVIAGDPGALLAMALPDFDSSSGVRIEGDAGLAQKFQQSVTALDPDLEKGLTEYFGDLLGPQVYRIVIEALDLARHTTSTGGEQVSRWLREESRFVPAPGEWTEFRDGVDRLREAVDRLESRVRRRTS
ncbi:MAG: SCP2 sterol-binding domain-containing protein [Wenzhouxiangellaceae bacterium]|nr:SCP2 sterol-binding domain-containing protein [Wenzhouxiangellaceae bacterium]MBS3747452.1 SCP2 sterol-binding domain-containing protein [Wenzhouxiangellaceae bacterium]MBS3823963.1 SCP2 sterol-binding domain-containing protein [Wenzhouxiangellaceae bacterium]